MAQEKKVPPKDMPKEVSIMGGCPVLGVSSHLLNLAEFEAEGKAKAPRLRAQQRGRVAKGKKGRLRAALRHLWGKIRVTKAYSEWIEVCRPRLRPHNSRSIHNPEPARRSERSGQSGSTLPKMSPKEEAR